MKKQIVTGCPYTRRSVQDTLDIISGKWKLIILYTLLERKFRFRELAKEISISPRMLSKELKDMEINELVSRTVCDTKPISVEYEITKHGSSLWKVIQVMSEWGFEHRDRIIRK